MVIRCLLQEKVRCSAAFAAVFSRCSHLTVSTALTLGVSEPWLWVLFTCIQPCRMATIYRVASMIRTRQDVGHIGVF